MITICYNMAHAQLTRKNLRVDRMRNERVVTIMATNDATHSGLDPKTLAHDVLRLWSARVTIDTPALTAFIPVLYDHIAELVAPGAPRPFGTDRACTLADMLANEGKLDDLHANEVVEELQIFRSALFYIARENALALSGSQCEQVGELIDATIREAIVHCTAVERAMRELSIAEFSHDMRNPLNIAGALAQLIERRPDNEKVAQFAGRISEKIAETDALIQSHVNAMHRQATSG